MMRRQKLLQEINDTWSPLKRALHQYFLRHFAALHLSPVQLEILRTIHQCQPVSHKDLAHRLQLTPGAVSQQLEGLEAADMIARNADPNDRRVHFLSVSTTGQKKLHELREASRHLLQEAFTDLTDDELAIYLKAQQKILQHVEHHTTK